MGYGAASDRCSVIQMATTSNFIDNSDKFYRLYLAFLKHDFNLFALFFPERYIYGIVLCFVD